MGRAWPGGGAAVLWMFAYAMSSYVLIIKFGGSWAVAVCGGGWDAVLL